MAKFVSRNQLPVDRGFELVVRENVELEVEAAIQLVLPLLGQTARADDEASLQIAARDHLLHQEAGHDGLAGARVVRQQKSQRLARQHLLVDRCDLVRQRFDERGMDGEHRIEQMRQPDAVRLGDEPKQLAVAVEAPGLALLRHLEAPLIGAVQDLVAHPPGRVLVGELQGVVAVPLNVDDGDERFGEDASHGRHSARRSSSFMSGLQIVTVASFSAWPTRCQCSTRCSWADGRRPRTFGRSGHRIVECWPPFPERCHEAVRPPHPRKGCERAGGVPACRSRRRRLRGLVATDVTQRMNNVLSIDN